MLTENIHKEQLLLTNIYKIKSLKSSTQMQDYSRT